jgi:translation initiation factor 2 gamma subunit (eIF-2gamma)
MNREDAKERVEEIKKLLKDYVELAPVIGIEETAQERTVDMFLDDLSKALKDADE